ncbi:band 4.1-like protein 1 isoform X2 [Ostrinia furnacalis]|uniref:band 4.1-like protein 1 isoform X2 n=1 Tax=Ostrinia furnacalis TaxID=93504 RepID=UPI00103A7C43|nr:band 4.1-like protein 1 isoform X2 [Ostrinia furnacalis]
MRGPESVGGRLRVDLNRRLSKTFRNEPWDVILAVKFYPPEPSELRDDVTRYQISLAVRRDLLEGRLTCSTITYALLASYVLQAELGDSSGDIAPSALTELRAAPLHALTPDLEERVRELYSKHKGQTPAEAELNYLENAKKLSLYGAELHCARDLDAVDIVLAVCASGVSVYRDGVLMNRFPWAKITKICYNKRNFTLKLRPSEFDDFETALSFKLPSTRACKKLWRCSVEHHIFFRRESPVKVERIAGFPRLGSRRVSCRRTLRQMRAEPPPPRAVIA